MNNTTSIEKRIKRHIVGKSHDFFVVVAPGFEKLCSEELVRLPLSEKNISATEGGVEFSGRVFDCWLANLCLRTANRVLMRVCSFKASAFDLLEKKLSDVPWELYLFADAAVSFHVTARKSRLYHTEAIAERFRRTIESRLLSSGIISPGPLRATQQVFIRIVKDRVTVSIDSSGENLYRRGVKDHGGAAPIRETIAAAALILTGYDGREPVIDPMCGSGTFSTEAAMMAMGIPPGFKREFAFMEWPCFREKRWAHIKKSAMPEYGKAENPRIFASDISRDNVDALKKSLAGTEFSGRVSVSRRDFFEINPSELAGEPGVVLINPPYGLRLGSKSRSRELIAGMCDTLLKDYKGWRFAVIIPEEKMLRQIPLRGDRTLFSHGGLKLTLLTGKIR